MRAAKWGGWLPGAGGRAVRGGEGEGRLRSAYVEAMQALLQDDEDLAVVRLSQAVRGEPGNLDAAVRLGTLLRQRGELERALRLHRNQLTRRDLVPVERSAIEADVARDLAAMGRYEEALELVEAMLVRSRRSTAAWSLKIELLEAAERWEDAYATLERAQKAEGRRDRAELARYQAVLGQRRLQAAEEVLAAAPEMPARSTDLTVKERAQAAAAEAARLREAARPYLKRALKLDKACVPALLYLGDLEAAGGDLKRADKWWRKALEAGGADVGFAAFGRIEEALFAAGRYDEIERLYHEHLGRYPGDARARVRLSEYHRRRGDAGAALSAVGELGDHEAAARKLLAVARVRALAAAGRAAEAVEESLELMGVQPEGVFQCAVCGHETESVLWRCPQCRTWRAFF
jgi:lipopolysaccharide biosynthesis regulator YciM